jgi:ubiquinone/menaquinone biosynthesis C-methylase UbiE
MDTTGAAAFDAAADGYDDAFHATVADALTVRAAGADPVRLVYDAATGSGAAAFAAVRLLDPERVVAVDFSPRMLERARQRADRLDPGGRIDWRTGPAVPAPLPDGSADVVLCASSLHFLGAAALRDWRRVLRPGGRVAFSLPTAATFTPSAAFAALVAADLPVPDAPDAAAALAAAAGFTGITAERLDVAGPHARTVLLVHATRPHDR